MFLKEGFVALSSYRCHATDPLTLNYSFGKDSALNIKNQQKHNSEGD